MYIFQSVSHHLMCLWGLKASASFLFLRYWRHALLDSGHLSHVNVLPTDQVPCVSFNEDFALTPRVSAHGPLRVSAHGPLSLCTTDLFVGILHSRLFPHQKTTALLRPHKTVLKAVQLKTLKNQLDFVANTLLHFLEDQTAPTLISEYGAGDRQIWNTQIHQVFSNKILNIHV